MSFAALPKVELHLHLDCSLSYEAVSQLRPSLTEAEWRRDYVLEEKCTDLADFLTKVPRCLALMQDQKGLQAVTAGLFQELVAENVIYAEIRFAPLQHLEQGLSAYEVVDIVDKVMAEQIKATGVEARLILCTLRHFSEEQGRQTAELAVAFKDRLVAGLDLAADEAGFPIEPHVAAFDLARKHGLASTAHAGEARGPESMIETLARLNPARIGHGVRSVEDPALMERLVEEEIHLEVCPACNVLIDVYPTLADHPVDQLYRAGVPLSINSDGRSLPRVTLNQQYRDLQETFGWGVKHFYQCNLNALKAAFIEEETRTTLIQRLQAGYDEDFHV